jgi:hypothetical protein
MSSSTTSNIHPSPTPPDLVPYLRAGVVSEFLHQS